MTKKKYDIKKTLVKVARVAVEVILAGAVAYITERPELLVLAPAFEFAYDYWKHR